MNIQDIKDPAFLKTLSYSELRELAQQIRLFLIEQVSKTGGHLSSNLGIVEITVAIHAMFNSPVDKLIFDVGHQSYVHKILTGRAEGFSKLRQFNGLSGYQNRSESEHDFWEAGHAGTSLSAALGCAIARDLKGETSQIITVIGDGSIANGESFEALNHIGSLKPKMIIILNDNNMSISKNVGAFAHSIARLRNSAPYTSFKSEVKEVLERSKVGSVVYKGISGVKETIKRNVIKPSIFTDLGLNYLGPIDGHSFNDLFDALHTANEHDGPVLIHAITTKGKGFLHSENDDKGNWHGVSSFDPDSGSSLSSLPKGHLSYSQVISETLVRLAKEDEKIVAITPAMIQGSKLEKFFALYPNRSFDCGIAEEHATTLAASLGLNGFKPFLSIYSSFLQRSYDQVNHDIARMNCPVVIGIDRAGLVGEDGATHHGVFDVGLLRAIPNVVLSVPKDASEAQQLLYTGLQSDKVFAMRYPRGSASFIEVESFKEIQLGTWEMFGDLNSAKCVLIANGPIVDTFIERIKNNKLKTTVVNARYIKPLDEKMLNLIEKAQLPILCYEGDMLAAGLGSAILEYFETQQKHVHLKRIGISDHFVTHGSLRELREHENLDVNHVLDECSHLMRKRLGKL